MDTKAQARILMMSHHHAIKNRQQSMLGRVAQEIGMDIHSSDHWNEIQGKPSYRARKNYDRSNATLS
ncbi:MAG: hypothetical protein IGQ45_11020 [Cyanobacterium sp. T60_A2020_053]|nr:hypothetical protein [Cyanobacterium sp. T60_A2020_053]